MHPSPSPDPPPSPRAGARLRVAAVAILVAGLLASTGVWIAAADDAAATADGPTARIVGNRVDTAADDAARDSQSERLGGQALVRTAAFDRWLRSLWHGRRLAWTLGVLAIALAAACAWIAALMDTPVDP